MNLASRLTTGNLTEPRRPGSEKQSLPGYLYLLERSLDRYGYLKRHEAPGILVNAEEDLIRRRLLSLCAALTK